MAGVEGMVRSLHGAARRFVGCSVGRDRNGMLQPTFKWSKAAGEMQSPSRLRMGNFLVIAGSGPHANMLCAVQEAMASTKGLRVDAVRAKRSR